jgi:hypothetical protein
MEYQEYISLGFERVELNDTVEFKRTGYNGFVLTKKLRSGVCIEVCSGSLFEPKLYIEKKNSIECFILQLTSDDILDLLNER